jgi:hypothetical protein
VGVGGVNWEARRALQLEKVNETKRNENTVTKSDDGPRLLRSKPIKNHTDTPHKHATSTVTQTGKGQGQAKRGRPRRRRRRGRRRRRRRREEEEGGPPLSSSIAVQDELLQPGDLLRLRFHLQRHRQQ